MEHDQRDSVNSKVLKSNDKADVAEINLLDNFQTKSDTKVSSDNISYQIRPGLGERFKPTIVQELIHEVLYEELNDKTYSPISAGEWTKKISDNLRDKTQALSSGRYKLMVQVVLGEQRGAGCSIGTRCLWDADSDTCASNQFVNESIFCMAAVFAVYFY